jgi:predicted phage-related endonuclease
MITYQNNNDLQFPQWLAARKESIGASEVSTIAYGSPYSSNLELFYDKLGGNRPNVNNIRTYIGKKSESIVDQFWPYYENGDDDSIWINSNNGKKLKECVNVNLTARNSKHPHVTSTPDRIILPVGVYAGRGKGSLEYKNTQSFVLNSYLPNLPPANVFQCCTQMMVEELPYGELFYFIDNRTYQEYAFTRKQFKSMEQRILDITTPFWENVKKGRPIFNAIYEAKRLNNHKRAAEMERELAQLEPPVQNSKGYLDFINKRYKDRIMTTSVIPGNNDQYLIAKKYQELSAKIDKLELQKQGLEIDLKNMLKEHHVLDFGAKGKVTWYTYESRRVFKNKVL